MLNLRKFHGWLGTTEKSGIINMCLKPVSMVLSLIYLPLLLSYLGDEKYGLWATLLSIINWISYFDVGIGNGLRNLLSKEITYEKYEEANRSVSTAYVVLTCIASVVYIALVLSVVLFNWNGILSTSLDIKPVLFITFTFICLNFVLALSNILLYALQQSEKIAIRGCAVQILNLIGLLIIRTISDSSLVAIALLFGCTTMIVYVFNSIQIFREKNFLKPSFKLFDSKKIREICNVGIKFFIIQVCCLLLFTVDNLLITHYFGPETVTPFSITNKVFHTAYTVLAAFLVPYWSRTTVAFAQNDYTWVKNSIKKVSALYALFILGYIVLVFIFKPLVAMWLGRELSYQDGLLPTMCVFYILYSALAVECQFINGSGKINVQLIMYCLISIANIPLSIYMGVTCGMGVVGIRLATTILVLIEVLVLGFNLLSIVKKLKLDAHESRLIN